MRQAVCLTCQVLLGLGVYAQEAGINFEEDNFKCSADASFVSRCVSGWQEHCRREYSHAPGLQAQLCDTHLDRNYVRIRTLLAPSDILGQWEWDRRRRDYDIGWVRAQFPKFTKTGAKYLPFGTAMLSTGTLSRVGIVIIPRTQAVSLALWPVRWSMAALALWPARWSMAGAWRPPNLWSLLIVFWRDNSRLLVERAHLAIAR